VNRRRRVAIAAGLACGLSACSAGGSPPTNAGAGTNSLEVMSWWTSGSERAALNVLFDDFHKTSPKVSIINGAVAGGAGSNVQVVLAARLQANNPPDVWQTFPGASIHQYVASGRIADVSSVYREDQLAPVMPKTILKALSQDGKQYGVPTSVHRSNVLWFNKKQLAKAGINPPSSGYTSDAFIADLAKLKAAGSVPLCLGAKDPFTTAELFENLLLSNLGPQGWARLTSDRLDWNGQQVQQALSQLSKALDNADPQSGALTWDQATKKLAAGGCAFETMNDSAYGELLKDGAREGTDFGYVPFPGTDSQFLAVVDTFVVARNAKDRQNALAFLKTIGSTPTQLAFSKQKGSVPVRTDVDTSTLPPYQQSAARALLKSTILLSIVHGEAMSPRFQQGFYDAVSTFVRSRDVKAFNQTLQNAVIEQQAPAH
jgi:glucose/mannose transport system substrate-binding protein